MADAPQPSPIDLSVAISAYQTTVGLATFYANIVWAVFNTMLVANSIVIAILTLITQTTRVLSPRSISCVGIVLCLCWLIIIKRAHEFAAYYTLSAREIEESLLAPHIRTLSRGGALADGNEVSLLISGSEKRLHLSFIARHVPGQTASLVIIVLFIAVYLFGSSGI
jgi:hypothetical protein